MWLGKTHQHESGWKQQLSSPGGMGGRLRSGPSGGGVKETGAPGRWSVGGAHKGPCTGHPYNGLWGKAEPAERHKPWGPSVHVRVLARDPRGAPWSRNWSQGCRNITACSLHTWPADRPAWPPGRRAVPKPGTKHSLPD